MRTLCLLAIAAVLAACAGPPSAPPAAPVVPPSASPSSPTPEPHPDFVVTPGAFCDHEGANGATKGGKPMRCVRKPGEERPRWRADP